MITLGIIAAYSLVTLVVGFRMATAIAWRQTVRTWERDRVRYPGLYGHRPMPTSVDDWMDGVMIAVFTAWAWPVVVPCLLFHERLTRPPRDVETKLLRAKVEQWEREEGIRK